VGDLEDLMECYEDKAEKAMAPAEECFQANDLPGANYLASGPIPFTLLSPSCLTPCALRVHTAATSKPSQANHCILVHHSWVQTNRQHPSNEAAVQEDVSSNAS